jgi:hypothetical protein
MASIQDRMLRAAKLDVDLYEEVEADPEAMGQATAVVVLAALAAGIGNFTTLGVTGLVVGTLAALVSWYIWAFLTYLIGTKLLPEPETQSDVGELLRTIGFASSPGLLRVFGVVPALGDIVFLVAGLWMLIAMVIAVRQALDYKSTGRAIGVCLIGWVIQLVVLTGIVSMLATE